MCIRDSNITGTISGSATSANTLTTPRNLWGQSFDGSANVTGNLTSVGNVTGSTAIEISAGGTNQNVTVNPSGTGYTLLNGNVGIGISVPSEKLEVNGNILVNGNIQFEGATPDAFETTLAFTDPTSDRTITFPNATGTIVLEATGSTLTNKSIDLGNNTISGSLAEFNTALQDDSFVGLAATQTLTNKTLTSPTLTSAVLNTAVSGSAFLDEDGMDSNSATKLASQQSIKAYVDAQITAQDLDITSDSGTIAIDLDSETLTIAGGTGISTSGSSNQITIATSADVVTPVSYTHLTLPTSDLV